MNKKSAEKGENAKEYEKESRVLGADAEEAEQKDEKKVVVECSGTNNTNTAIVGAECEPDPK